MLYVLSSLLPPLSLLSLLLHPLSKSGCSVSEQSNLHIHVVFWIFEVDIELHSRILHCINATRAPNTREVDGIWVGNQGTISRARRNVVYIKVRPCFLANNARVETVSNFKAHEKLIRENI
jgi:hypothetical protein